MDGIGLVFRLIIVFIFLGLFACTVSPATLSPTCRNKGTIGSGKVLNPTHGFEISFQYYLPPCYDQAAPIRYPVIYLIAMPFESELDEVASSPMSLADRLIRARNLAPVILVVPTATVAPGYHAALATDLVPYIDEIFNTLDDQQHRAVGGISHGAGISARIAFQFPGLFGSLGIFSGGIDPSEETGFTAWIDASTSKNFPRILIDVGNADPILPLTENLTGVLDSRNVPYSLNRGEGGHSWTYWSGRMEFYLLWFADAWE